MNSRLRVAFQRGEPVKYTSHLDTVRVWLRAFRRAGLPIAYTEGFSPHPRISFALPLPVGVLGDEEFFDLELSEVVEPARFLTSVAHELPTGIVPLDAWEVAVTAAPLARLVRSADFEVLVETDRDSRSLATSVEDLLALTTLPWERTRDKKTRTYDLRTLIERISYEGNSEGLARLLMRLVADSSRAGRPDDVLAALGFREPVAIVRRQRLHFSESLR